MARSQTFAFKKNIIAGSSQAVLLPCVPDEPRVMDSTVALALQEVIKRMLDLSGGMVGETALAIEMGTDAAAIGKTIHPHPALGENIGMAAEVTHGCCTKVPPVKK